VILIGSRALKFRAPFLLHREPKDFDWVCTEAEYSSWILEQSGRVGPINIKITPTKRVVRGAVNCEFELINPSRSSELLLQLVVEDPDTMSTPFGLVPSLDMLFTIKSSHKYLRNSPHFWKNLSDYHLMKMVGAKVRPEFEEFHKMREKETYTYNHPKLNVGKADFFSEDGVGYVYDHDSIHATVALADRPAYTYFQKDGAEVLCDKNKFFACPREIQLYSVVEESAVLAIERSLVPHPGKMTPEKAWRLSLSKVCTSISSGWWRAFAYENALDCLKLYPSNYWERFQIGLASGVVKPHKTGN
jgi:hypothetical protein